MFHSPEVTTSETPTVSLSDLEVSRANQMWGLPQARRSVGEKPIQLDGKTFEDGVGTHATSRMYVQLLGRAKRFTATVGVDDNAGDEKGSVEFRIIGDKKLLWSSGKMAKHQSAKEVSVDLARVQQLTLEVTDAGDGIDGDWGDWADARFEGVRGKILIVDRLPEHDGKIVPGSPWRDTAGNLIQAHGGGIMIHQGKYYWYGEDRSEGYVGIGVSGYVSDDLVNWKPLGVVLPRSAYDAKWKDQTINERPKVVYNPRTKKFVMWFHYDRSGYGDSQAGVAIAEKPEGPFRYLGQHRPIESSTYRDMNLFVDTDGSAYAIYAGEENATMHIVRLNSEWTAPEQPMVEGKTWIRTFVNKQREAPAPFKYNGKYYLITSACTGWAPNAAGYAVADRMLGEWKSMPNPFVRPGNGITFGSQSTFVLPAAGRPGEFIFLGDRWTPSNLADARYIWLPFKMERNGTFQIQWTDAWSPAELGFRAAGRMSDLQRGVK